MKLIGVLFVVLSAASVGFRFSYAVKQRCDLIGQLQVALRLLKSEISNHGTPLPEAFAVLAAATRGNVALYFSTAAKQMDQKRWMTPADSLVMAEDHLRELPANDPVRRILKELANGLGRLSWDNQLHSIDCAMVRLEEMRRIAEQDRTIRCRTYRTLGLCAGLALAILLI